MEKTTLKTKLMDFVESLGRPASWSEIHTFIINEKIKEGRIDKAEFEANPRKFRGWAAHHLWNGGPASFSWTKPGYFRRPSKCDQRYLDYSLDGKWIVKKGNVKKTKAKKSNTKLNYFW